MNIIIRQETIEDYQTTENVVKRAFADSMHSDQTEHELVSRIRKSDAFIPVLSLIAVEREIVGHILLSKIKIHSDKQTVDSLALAPVAVLPAYQKQGIGKLLIHAALKKAKELGFHSVIVLGHPEYYPKFGFKKAAYWGIQAPFDVPEEAFMALELTDNGLYNVSGIVEYSSAFSV
ncbi:GNAT family N-acetyltransferase [Niallia sp. NCCP-28]|uniref:GNAT family N-acetyltransferase n=1 Tax=Niallia sp. NCCP-28 TaxID=2934712 RepID=UPI002082AA9B|nr:N-acetyltransferase [Niallia sp. NCCP-28]GKU83056.1 N-acetyltransferase [Niallia sp. NCCP-28]